jgi:hypothetical protein
MLFLCHILEESAVNHAESAKITNSLARRARASHAAGLSASRALLSPVAAGCAAGRRKLQGGGLPERARESGDRREGPGVGEGGRERAGAAEAAEAAAACAAAAGRGVSAASARPGTGQPPSEGRTRPAEE